MFETDQYDLAYNKMREAAERQASVLATDTSAKLAHKTLAHLYGDRVVSARRKINADRCS